VSDFWFAAPYSEADHVLDIAFNLLAGGECLEHLELRRNDEAYLDALGTQRSLHIGKALTRRRQEISIGSLQSSPCSRCRKPSMKHD
jgi:hypothetical protein